MTRSYSPSPIKRRRRTKAEIEALKATIYNMVWAGQPMTVRQVFYQLTVRHAIGKSEAEYSGTVVRLLTQMRRDRMIPYAWISDNTRWIRKPTSYSGIEQALNSTAHLYRRNLWIESPVYVEIWCEKDALAGVIMDETEIYDVPLMVSRGFSSDTYLQSAAEAIEQGGKPAYIYHFGDHDPSGVWIARKTEEGLRRHAPKADIHFERIAVTESQIAAWNLPSRPTKKTDSRAKTFRGESVELDSIAPEKLRQLVRDCIDRHVDQHQLGVLLEAEKSERQLLTGWAKAYAEGARA